MNALLFIPTLNESGTISELLREINELHPDFALYVIDDNSSDGTIEILKNLECELPVTTLIRAGKLGIGSAHINALNYARDNGYELMISMDADGAHSPRFIPQFIDMINNADLVVGSRYMREDSLSEWSNFRKFLTRAVHQLTRLTLGLKFDSSSGFRCYRISRMPEVLFSGLRSSGYDFFFESMYEVNLRRLEIREVSIVLPARTYGHSKMTPELAMTALKTLFFVSLRRLSRMGSGYEEQQ